LKLGMVRAGLRLALTHVGFASFAVGVRGDKWLVVERGQSVLIHKRKRAKV
jgi:hypothetical protein